MTRAHARVYYADILRRYLPVPCTNFFKLRLNLWLLLRFVKVVLPALTQIIVRMSLYPQSAEGVLDHVADYPMRRKQLGRSRYIFLCDFDVLFESCKHLVLRFSVVVLVHPADYLDLTLFLNIEIVLGNIVHQMEHNAVLVCIRQGEQEFRVVIRSLKQLRQNIMQVVALPDEQHTEQFFQPVIVTELIYTAAFLACKFKSCVKWRGNYIRLMLAGFRGQHSYRQIAVHFHETNSYHTVEPGIGDFLDDVLECRFIVIKLFCLRLYCSNKGITLCNLSALYLNVILCSNIEQLQVLCRLRERLAYTILGHCLCSCNVFDIIYERFSCPYCKIFECCLIHLDFSLKFYCDDGVLFKGVHQLVF